MTAKLSATKLFVLFLNIFDISFFYDYDKTTFVKVQQKKSANLEFEHILV